MPFLDGKPVIITKRNTDKHGNPISTKQIETKQVVDIHNSIPLNYSIDRNHPIVISGMHQTYNKDRITENTFFADYDQGILYFHPSQVSKSLTITYMATGYILISSDRIYRYNKGDGTSATESIEASFEKLENLMNTIIQNGGGCDQIVAEVIGSRTDAQGQTFPSLGDRLNHIDIQLDNLTAMVKYVRTETMKIEGNTVGVGINEYSPTKDILNVYLSGVKMIEGIDYSLDKDNRIITNLKGQWIIGDQIHFEVYQRMIDRNMLPDTPITSMNAQNVTVAPNVLGKDNVQDVLVDMELTLRQVPNKKDYVAKAGDTMTGNLVMDNNSKVVGDLEGNSDTATKLKTARDIAIGNATKQFDGTQDLTWTLDEIGVSPINHNHSVGDVDLNGYNKGNQNGPLDQNDSLSDALSKLENNIQTAGQGNFLPVAGGNMFGYINFANTLGLANTNKKFLRTETLETILSSANGGGTIYLRPNGDLDQISQVKIESNGNVTADTFVGDLQGNATTATRLQTPRTLTIGATGKQFDGGADVTWSLDDIGASPKVHTHNVGSITLDGYNKGNQNGALTPNDSLNDAFSKIENNLDDAKKYTDEKVADIVNSAPATLDTLKELADALGNDPNFATTVTNQIGQKADRVYVDTQLANKANAIDVTNLQNNKADKTELTNGLAAKADLVHTHTSNQITAMTGYTKPNTTSAIGQGDSLNVAIGKLERALDNKQASGNYLPTTGGNMTGQINTNSSVNFTNNSGGLLHNGNSVFRNNGTDTVVSAINGGIFFRPQGSTVTNPQVQISTNGNVIAPSFTGALNGNATTATRLQNPRTITIGHTGKQFDGSTNVSWALNEIITSPIGGNWFRGVPSISPAGVMEIGRYIDFHSTDTSHIDFSTRLQSVGDNANTVNLPTRSGTLALTIDNVASATRLQNTRNIALQGDVTGTAPFDGSANATINATLVNVARNNTNVAENPNFGGTFTAVSAITSDTKGRVTGVQTKTVTLPNIVATTDEKVKNTPNNTVKAYLTGTTTATEFTGTQVFDTNVFLDTTAGHLTATQFNGRLNGNATTATTLQNARTITIGKTSKPFNGSQNVAWTLDEIGAAPTTHNHGSNNITTLTGYNKGAHNGALTTNDTLNVALAKLENGIQNAGAGNYLPLTGGTLTGRLTANGKVSIPTTGGQWLNGKTVTNASIGITTKQTANSYHPILAVQTSSGNVANIGGLGDNFGFYGYLENRTTNGTDWSFVFDSNTGNVRSTGTITAPTFIGNLNGNATTSTTLQTPRTITIGKTGRQFNGGANVSWTLNDIVDSPTAGNWFRGVPTVATDGVMEIGKYIDFHNTNATTRDYSTRLQCNGDGGNTVNLPTNGGTLALLTDNVASATRLQTARKINGTDFNGTTDITTAKWGTARSITIGNTTKQVDGSGNVSWTLQEIGAGAGTNATYKTTVNANQWVANGTNYKFLVTHNLNANIVHVGAVHSTTNESILVPYKIINNNSLEVYTVDRNLSMNITVISEALAAGGGGGGITSITTNGQVYNAVGNNITLPNHLLLTGGTVTGATTFRAGVTIGNTSRITEQAGGLNISSPSITLGGGDIYIQNPMRFVGHGLEDNGGNWKITQGGIATFKGVNAHNDLVCSGTVTGKDSVGGATTWVIHRVGEAVFDSIKNNQLHSTWSIDSNGNSELNNITARGAIYGKNRIALNNGTIYLPQGGGNIVADHLRIGGGFMACKDDGTMHFLTSGGNPTNLYGAGFIQGSDIKLKENIRYIDAPKKTSKDIKDDTITKDELFNFIKNLKVCEYNYIESDNDKIGFIANDVVGDKVGDKIVLEDGGVLSYDTSNMLFATIGALQEEIKKRESLEKENNELKDRLLKIEKMLGI